MSSNAILVTGGAGYVGAHTCKALSRGGYLPIVIDNLSTGHESFVRWGPLIKADIRDTDAVANAITTFKRAPYCISRRRRMWGSPFSIRRSITRTM